MNTNKISRNKSTSTPSNKISNQHYDFDDIDHPFTLLLVYILSNAHQVFNVGLYTLNLEKFKISII